MVNMMKLMICLTIITKELDTIEMEIDIIEIIKRMIIIDQEVKINIISLGIPEIIEMSYTVIPMEHTVTIQITFIEETLGEMKTTTEASGTKIEKESNAGEEMKKINKFTQIRITITLRTVPIGILMMMIIVQYAIMNLKEINL